MNHAEVLAAEGKAYHIATTMPSPSGIAKERMKEIINAEPFLITGMLASVVPISENARHGMEFNDALSALNSGKLDNGIVVAEVWPACRGVGHCAVGALLVAAGLPNATVSQLPDHVSEWFDPRTHELLWKHYGIVPAQTAEIMDVNDDTGGDDENDEMERAANTAALMRGEITATELSDRSMVLRRRYLCRRIDELTFRADADIYALIPAKPSDYDSEP